MSNTPLLVQICLPIIYTTNKLSLRHFLVYMAKYPHAKKFLKIHRVDPEENASQTGRQTDGQMNRTDFIRLLPKSLRFNYVFWKFKNKIWK